MKKKIAIIGIATFAMFGVSFLAQAAKLTTAEKDALKAERAELREGMKENKAELKEGQKGNREQIKEQKCKNVQARIRTRIKRYENKQTQSQNVFGNLVSRVESVNTKLKEKGLDTSKLESDSLMLKEKINELNIEHEKFIAGLESAENNACGESDGEYKKQLGDARKMSTEVRGKLIEVREYYQATIRADILELRDELLETSVEDGESE